MASAAALIVACLVLPGASPAAAATVGGTVTVDRVPLRTDGPKHDLDVVLWLERADGAGDPASDARVSMDQRGLVFLPHVLAVQRGTTVTFLNNDNDQHNVYFLFDETGETLDIGTWGPGISVDHRFEETGEVIVLCKLHLEMAAYVVVVDTPLFVQVELDRSERTASFEIPDVPPGEYELNAWHKKLKQKGGASALSLGAGGPENVDVLLAKRP